MKNALKTQTEGLMGVGARRESNWFAILAFFLSHFLISGNFSNIWNPLIFLKRKMTFPPFFIIFYCFSHLL